MTNQHDTTALIRAAAAGDSGAGERLLAALYPELREIAHKLSGKRVRPGQVGDTLQPTALVHEAYLRLFTPHGMPATVRDREHLLNLFARCMRHVLLDYVTQRKAQKRGGGVRHLPLDGQILDHHAPRQRCASRWEIDLDSMIEAPGAPGGRLPRRRQGRDRHAALARPPEPRGHRRRDRPMSLEDEP